MHKIIIPILHPRKNNLFKNKEGLILDIFTNMLHHGVSGTLPQTQG